MATVDGYHVFAIPESYLYRGDAEERIKFTELRTSLGDGYRSRVGFGSANGLRRWSITMPTLAGLSVLPNLVESINGGMVSREEYLWDLYCSRQPFIIPSPRSGQYYLAEFADTELSYKKAMLAQIYSTGVEITQIRIRGKSVYAPELLDANIEHFSRSDDGDIGPGEWVERLGQGFIYSGDVLFGQTGPNDYDVISLNSVASDGLLSQPADPSLSIKDLWIVMKMREATFSNNAGVFTAPTGHALLVGDTGTTKFFDLGLGANVQYSLNDVEYPENNQQAPMNEWGIVRLTSTVAVDYTASGLQMGQDRDFASREANMDIAAVLWASEILPANITRELYESFAVRYQIGS